MVAAIFALIGTLLGVLVALGIELSRRRADDIRARRESLLQTCADFSSEVTRMRMIAGTVKANPTDAVAKATMQEATLNARASYERLRLISTSLDVQKSGRYALRYAYGIVRMAEGRLPREDERERGPILLTQDSLLELYANVRHELGLPRPNDVFREPEEWLGWGDMVAHNQVDTDATPTTP
jgi:hypothetical protein